MEIFEFLGGILNISRAHSQSQLQILVRSCVDLFLHNYPARVCGASNVHICSSLLLAQLLRTRPLSIDQTRELTPYLLLNQRSGV